MLDLTPMKPLVAKPLPVEVVTSRMRLRNVMRGLRALHNRERLRVRAEIQRIPGLMTLLMKPRNGERWSAEDRAVLRTQLRGLGLLGLYVTTLAVPGTVLTLPLLAWWLDRRRVDRTKLVSGNKSDTTPTPPSQ